MCVQILLVNICPIKSEFISRNYLTEGQSFHYCFPKFCNECIADAVMNLWYPSIQEFVLSENAGSQLAKTDKILTKIVFKSKTVSCQFVEYSSASNFIRSTYVLYIHTFWHLYHLSIVYLESVRERNFVNHKREYGNKM